MMASPYLHSGRPDLVPGLDPFALYKYETRSNTFRHIAIPEPERTDSTQINLYSLAATPDALYLSYVWDSRGNLVSTDRGITWNELDVPDSLGVNHAFQFYAGSDSNDIVVVVPDGPGRKYAIGRDGGESWKQLDGPIASYIDYAESAVLYLGDDRILIHARDTGALMMNDTTGEWSVVSYPPVKDISALALSPSGSIIMCSDKGGIFSSDDDGESWTMLNADYNTTYKVKYDLGFFGASEIVAVNTMGEIYITHDLGTSWELPRETPFVVSRLIWAEDDRAVVTMAHWKTWDYSEYITNDGYRSFQKIDDIPGYSIHPVSAQLWYSLARIGGNDDTLIFRSEDAGESWHAVYVDTDSRLLSTSSQTYDSAYTVFPMTKGLLYTSDGGSTWSWIQNAEWSANHRPVIIRISPFDRAIWYTLKDSTGTYKVVRSSPDFREWKVVLELSQEERQRVYHISTVRPLETGEVLAVAVLKYTSKQREKNILTMYSDDNGESWQSYETVRSSDDREIKTDAGATVLPNGGVITDYSVFQPNTTTLVTLYASTDYGRTDTLALETSSIGGIDVSNYLYSDNTANTYYKQTLSIYRISFPDVTSVRSPDRPPLPLSIGTPYPHPVSRTVESTTLHIQSDHTVQVSMTVHDLSGRMVGHLFDGELGPEGRHVTWSAGTLAPGMYVLQLKSSAGVCRRKVIVE
ncbi:MAG: T9SS type A sorting domain-containing protein [Bacteroidetes bacterium]|nr:T9SS type A sorting domain-containing protein [Bacteroidota bacterium]